MLAHLVERLRCIVSLFFSLATAFLKEKLELLGLPEHILKQNKITRWNSLFDTLETFLGHQLVVCASLLDKKLRKCANNVRTLQ